MKRKIVFLSLLINFVYFSIALADTIHLMTEDYPPFNMRVNGEALGNKDDPLTGISVDIIRELFKRAGLEYTISIYPWNRSYNTALKETNYGVFSTFRTPEREPLFYWVGPLVPNKWILMANKNKKIKINSLNEVCDYKIGGYRGDAIVEFLIKQGCRVEITSYDHQNAKKLQINRIELWATGSMLGPYLAKREKISDLEQVFVIKESPMYLALNKSISSETVLKLNTILKAMKDDGNVEQIFNNYR